MIRPMRSLIFMPATLRIYHQGQLENAVEESVRAERLAKANISEENCG
ncbi:MAG: hypothetical protein HC846_11375, partial [Blastocatellia bacterium]|nr:hypothetical protein [Blastocatellia bacterium]